METLHLLADVIPLGLAAAVTPTLIALQLLVVCGDEWIRRALAVAAANAVAFAIVVTVVLAGLAQLPDRNTGTLGPIDLWLRIGCGTLLLVSAVYFFLPHPELAAKVQGTIERRTRNASVWLFFGISFYFSITDFSTFIVIIPALHGVTVSDGIPAAKVLAVAVLMVLALMPTWVPPTTRAPLAHRIEPALGRAYRYVMTHQFPIVGSICVAAGAFLVISALLRRP